MRKILLNRIKTPDGTILTSRYRHDYNEHDDDNGLTYAVDGGFDYISRFEHDDAPYTELSIYDDDPHDVKRQYVEWGTYGIDGNDDLKWVKVDTLTTEHINNILQNLSNLYEPMKQLLKDELIYRKENKICLSV